MELEIIMLSKVNLKEKYCYDNMYMWNLIMTQMNTPMSYRHREIDMVAKRRGRERDGLEVWISRCKLVYAQE